MLIPCTIRLVTTSPAIRQLFAVYTHADETGTVHYVGVSTLEDLFKIEDARHNSHWPQLFGGRTQTLDMNVVVLTDNEREAFGEQRRLAGLHKATCNRNGHYIDPRSLPVVCNETGQTWSTARAASDATGVTYSQLINHLNGKPGYRTCKGLTFTRQLDREIEQ